MEARTVSHVQLAEQMPGEQFTTLHTDGTTKFGHKYGSYQVSTETSCYTLGLADMQSGTAVQTLEVLKQVLNDIGKAEEQHGKSHTPSLIFAFIKNTMSDRHIVEKNYNELLQTYWAKCLPEVVRNWQNMTTEEQLEVGKMNNFFCGMHFMIAMTDQADKTLKEWEKLQFDGEKVGAAAMPGIATGSESGTIRLVRTVCKAVEKHGSEQVGCSFPFSEYLKTQGIEKVPLSSFKGNRFDIVFHNAAGVYFLNEHVKVFLESMYGTGNRLLQAVLADVKVKEYVAVTRALGLINKMITVPLWRVTEDKSLGILDMDAKYTSMRDTLKIWSEGASVLLTGETFLFNDTLINRDIVFEKLVEQSDDGSITVEVLQ